MEQTPKMTEKDAFQLLTNAAMNYKGTRTDHALLDQALQTIAPLVPNASELKSGGVVQDDSQKTK